MTATQSSSSRVLRSSPNRLRRCALGAGLLLAGSVAAQEASTLADSAWQQIAAISRFKKERNEAQQKLDTRLLIEVLRQRRDRALEPLPALATGLAAGSDGRLSLDLRGEVDSALLAEIAALGGQVESSFPDLGAVRLRLPLARVEELAALPAIRHLRPADAMRTDGNVVITQGDTAHRAGVVRNAFGVNGSGVKACAISDSVDALAAIIASGELPAGTQVLTGQSGNPGTSEGTALLEILHDLAPGASLMFATGKGGQAQMAQNILGLAAAGCDVIVDDVFYFGEPAFQDGVIAQAVDQVVAAGVLYFSSAGNSGRLDAGTSGVFEGTYTAGTLPPPLSGAALSAHNFGGGVVGNQITEQAMNDAPFFTLWWANPLGGAGDDLDLFLLDNALANVIAFSTNTQNGNDDPFELIDSQAVSHTGRRLVVTKFSGGDPFFQLNTHRGILQIGTDGQITGHAAAQGAIAVAATNVSTAGGGAFTGGAANPVEAFSSDGPRRIFFNPDGSPAAVAGGASLGVGPVVRMKPELTLADGVATTTPGFTTFFGTSASAPHGAGLATLALQLFPGRPPSFYRDIFTSSALGLNPPGFDRNSGFGIAMGDALAVPVFSDGFESGNTSAWSNVVP